MARASSLVMIIAGPLAVLVLLLVARGRGMVDTSEDARAMAE